MGWIIALVFWFVCACAAVRFAVRRIEADAPRYKPLSGGAVHIKREGNVLHMTFLE